ncbi:MAG TPA: Wzz/FepE/Etk N-terminal domain-containing protein [Gemmatimonadales bacterium]|nr:Wzz/FepE/Etk N-terminal domain-containing protein [Gemmatimonadales bacterium]
MPESDLITGKAPPPPERAPGPKRDARPEPERAPRAAGPEGEIRLQDALRVLGAEWRQILLVAAASAAIALVILLLLPRDFTAKTIIMPQQAEGSFGGLGNIAGLAAQFGVALPAEAQSDSPELYASLLRARSVLTPVLRDHYQWTDDDERRSGTLTQALDVKGDTPAIREDKALRKLRDHMTVTTDDATGTVEFTVVTGFPALSHAVADRVLRSLTEFNTTRRQSRAKAERAFAESRQQDAKDSLDAAESALATFLAKNRQFEDSPLLGVVHDRLQRRVQLYQQLYQSLTQSYEQARVDEVRDTPVFTVLDPPIVPPRPDPRWLLLKVPAVALVAAMIAGLVVLAKSGLGSA